MQPPPLALGLMPSYEQPMEPPSKADVQAVASEVVRFIPHLTGMLPRPAPTAVETQEIPYGVLAPPLGRQRITVIELGQALLATNESVAVRAMLDSEFIPRAMDLFQQYPFHSILHSNVLDMLGTLIDALTPSQIGADGQPTGAPAAHLAGEPDSMPGQDPGDLLGGAAGGPPVVGVSMEEDEEFAAALGPGFDFSEPQQAPGSEFPRLAGRPAADRSIDSSGSDAAVEPCGADADTAAEGAEDAAPDGTPATVEQGEEEPGAVKGSNSPPTEAEKDVDVSMDTSADDGDDVELGDPDAPSPPPPPPQRNIVRPGSISGPSGAATSVAPAVAPPEMPEGVAVAEADESAATEPDAAKVEVGEAGVAGAEEEEDTEVGDDQNILECLLDKVNIIGWLLKLNSDSDAEYTYFQVCIPT